MAGPNDFTGQNIQNTYQRVLQVSSSSQVTDGTGSLVTFLPISASHAASADFAISASHEITIELSSSHAQTADALTPGVDIDVRNITASGDISASGDIKANQYNIKDHIIIQESGDDIILGPQGSQLIQKTIGSALKIVPDITASGDISASKNIIAKDITIHNGGRIGDFSNNLGTPGGDDYIQFDYTNRKIITQIDNTHTLAVGNGQLGINTSTFSNKTVTVNGSISASGQIITNNSILASLNISASGNILGSEITASGNISASGTGSFSYLNIVHDNNPTLVLKDTTNNRKLEIEQNDVFSIIRFDDHTTQDLKFISNNDGNHLVLDAGNGFTGLGTDSPVEKLTVIGNISASGTVTANSASLSGKIDVVGRSKFGSPTGTDNTSHQFYGQTGDTNFFLIVDKDGEEVMKGSGAVADGNLTYAFGDNAGAGNGVFFKIEDGNNRGFFKNGSNNAHFGINTTTPGEELEVVGNISASGTIVASNLSGTNTGDQNLSNLAITGSNVIFGNITASGNISASGDIIATGTGSFGRLEATSGTALQLQNNQKIQFENAAGTEFGNIFMSTSDQMIFQNLRSNKDIFIRAGNAGNEGNVIIQKGGTETAIAKFGTTADLDLTGNLTASGNISASGNVIADPNDSGGFMLGSLNALSATAASNTLHLGNNSDWAIIKYGRESSDQHSFNGNITASGDISASGILISSKISIDSAIEHKGDNTTKIEFSSDDRIDLVTDFSVRARIDNDGVNVNSGRLNVNSNITASGNISSSGIITAASMSIGGDYVAGQSPIQFRDDVRLFDNAELRIGNGPSGGETVDLKLYHDGTDSYIQNSSGEFIILQSSGDTTIKNFGTDDGVNIILDKNPFNGAVGSTGTVLISGSANPGIRLDVRGDITASGGIASGDISASGNIITSGEVSASGNITGQIITAVNNIIANRDIIGDGETNILGLANISASSTLQVPHRVFNTGSAVLGSDGGSIGDVVKFGNSTTLAGGLYALSPNGTWTSTCAASSSLSTGSIAVALGTNSTTDGMLLRGMTNMGAATGASIGAPVFLSTTSLRGQAVAPSASGDFVRIIGHQFGTDLVYFNPSPDFIEVS